MWVGGREGGGAHCSSCTWVEPHPLVHGVALSDPQAPPDETHETLILHRGGPMCDRSADKPGMGWEGRGGRRGGRGEGSYLEEGEKREKHVALCIEQLGL